MFEFLFFSTSGYVQYSSESGYGLSSRGQALRAFFYTKWLNFWGVVRVYDYFMYINFLPVQLSAYWVFGGYNACLVTSSIDSR